MNKNDYSWDLDVIEHKATGKAHLSEHWTASMQKAYNHDYYQQNKDKWKRNVREFFNPITGNADQDDMKEATQRQNEEAVKGWEKMNNAVKNGGSGWNEFVDMSNKTQKAYDDYDAAKKHYEEHTLEGRAKSGNQFKEVREAANDAIDRFNGNDERAENVKRTKKSLDRATKWDDKRNAGRKHKHESSYHKDAQKAYDEALKEYNNAPGQRLKRAGKAGHDFINALFGK